MGQSCVLRHVLLSSESDTKRVWECANIIQILKIVSLCLFSNMRPIYIVLKCGCNLVKVLAMMPKLRVLSDE